MRSFVIGTKQTFFFILFNFFISFDGLSSKRLEPKQFCMRCHGRVRPQQLPREKWTGIIEQMYRYAGSLETFNGKDEYRPDYLMIFKESPFKLDKKNIPLLKTTIAAFTKEAPSMNDFVKQYPNPGLVLGKKFIKRVGAKKVIPFLSHIQYVNWKEKGSVKRLVLMSDMVKGFISSYDLDKKSTKIILRVKHPSHFEVVDLNKDGLLDLIVSDLGQLMTSKTSEGKILWFENDGKGDFKKHILAENLGRCADVRFGDYDKDGDIDLVAADFGYMRGKVFLLKNIAQKGKAPKFKQVLIDSLSGAINSEFVDFNNDGLLDIVAVYSQEHEKIIAYYQTKNGFDRKVLADAGNPGWGSSGMTIGDIDKDGDMDILWLNGDIMDNFIVKPNQGLYLLENKGKGKLTKKFLGFFPGIHKAKIGDVDGDGDPDIVGVSALFPFGVKPKNITSIAWFERKKNGDYKMHPIETNNNQHFSLILNDVDQDKDLDLIIANASMKHLGGPPPKKRPKGSLPWIDIFENKN